MVYTVNGANYFYCCIKIFLIFDELQFCVHYCNHEKNLQMSVQLFSHLIATIIHKEILERRRIQ